MTIQELSVLLQVYLCGCFLAYLIIVSTRVAANEQPTFLETTAVTLAWPLVLVTVTMVYLGSLFQPKAKP